MESTTTDTQPHDARTTPSPAIAALFPRIELPEVPTLGAAPVIPVPRPRLDEPAPTWRNPLPAPDAPSAHEFLVVPPPPATIPAPAAATPQVAPAAPAPAPAPMPVPIQLPDPGAAGDAVPGGTSLALVVTFGACAALLAWASNMAFSSALLALASLLVAQLAAALFAGGAPVGRMLAAVALLVGAFAGWKGVHELSPDAFVAGLFVLVAVAPLLLLMGVVQLLLRRRAASAGDRALRAGATLRFVALAAVLVAGIQAHRTYSARLDAIATILVVALTVVTVVRTLRPAQPAST